MARCIAVVFWNPDEPKTKSAVMLHELEEVPDPAELVASPGLSVRDFFVKRNFPLIEAIKLFPGYIIPADEIDRGAGWDDTQIRWQCLPSDLRGLEKLANLAGVPVYSFIYYRGRDEVPRRRLVVMPGRAPVAPTASA